MVLSATVGSEQSVVSGRKPRKEASMVHITEGRDPLPEVSKIVCVTLTRLEDRGTGSPLAPHRLPASPSPQVKGFSWWVSWCTSAHLDSSSSSQLNTYLGARENLGWRGEEEGPWKEGSSKCCCCCESSQNRSRGHQMRQQRPLLHYF